ncbi:MAG: 50S ribosomal protein L9 [Spirochaetes bacterium]|nr:50S ribosomal protein L9 [Spirochaetota bacterium]
MGSIKIILKQDIPNLGEEGDIKFVKRGYARNYLLPQKKARNYSKQNINILETQKEYLENKKLTKIENANKLKEKLENEKISLPIQAGEKGRLYGTVTTSSIIEELNKLEYQIDKKEIELKEHIKFGGIYKYRIHLYHDIYAIMELNVIATQDKKQNINQKKRKTFDKQPIEVEAKPVEAEAKPVEAEAKPVEAEAKPVEAEAKPIEVEAKPIEDIESVTS